MFGEIPALPLKFTLNYAKSTNLFSFAFPRYTTSVAYPACYRFAPRAGLIRFNRGGPVKRICWLILK